MRTAASDETTGPTSTPMPDTNGPDTTITVRDGIRSSILEGEYAPRQRLIEVDLCERFGASRFVVRTALQELAAQGLVELQRNSGARVRDVSLAEAIEITQVRKLLEGHIAREAATRITKHDAAALRQIIKDMRAAVAAGEVLRYGELNAALHVRLSEISQQRIATQFLQQLRDLTVRHRFTLALVPGRPSVSLPQHEAVVAAVVNKQPEEAEAAMHTHLQSVIDAFNSFEADTAPRMPMTSI